jgi:hypothetical protein
MTALSITTSQLLPVSGPTVTGVIGAALSAGSAVYFDTTTGKWKAGQCDGSAAEAGAAGYGLTLATTAADGQKCAIALPGAVVTLGAAAGPAAGTVYAFAAAAGSLAPVADMVTHQQGDAVRPRHRQQQGQAAGRGLRRRRRRSVRNVLTFDIRSTGAEVMRRLTNLQQVVLPQARMDAADAPAATSTPRCARR